MTSRKSILGLAPLVALALCAFMAQGASAAWTTSTNTTAFTCLKGGTKDYSDAHCDNKVASGEFGHELIPLNTKTTITSSNQKVTENTTKPQTAVMHGTIGGIAITITATTANGEGFIENTEPKAGEHRVGGEFTLKYTGLSVDGALSKCKVKEPIEVKTTFTAVHNAAGEMGTKFTPKEGETFTSITTEGAECPTKVTAPVKGTVIGTAGPPTGLTAAQKAVNDEKEAKGETATTFEGRPTANGSGATTVREPWHEMEELKFGGAKATIEAVETVTMKEGNPIARTTVT
jgi:hypothetical protein